MVLEGAGLLVVGFHHKPGSAKHTVRIDHVGTGRDGCLQLRIFIRLIDAHLEENASDLENETIHLVHCRCRLVYFCHPGLA